jgi:histidinol-phosphate aminotransferase
VHPSFTEPEVALRAGAARRAAVVLDAPWELRAADVPRRRRPRRRRQPDQPDRRLHRRQELAALCRPGRVTLVDESFMDFVPGEPETLAAERGFPASSSPAA